MGQFGFYDQVDVAASATCIDKKRIFPNGIGTGNRAGAEIIKFQKMGQRYIGDEFSVVAAHPVISVLVADGERAVADFGYYAGENVFTALQFDFIFVALDDIQVHIVFYADGGEIAGHLSCNSDFLSGALQKIEYMVLFARRKAEEYKGQDKCGRQLRTL